MKASIVIPAYKPTHLLKECLDRLIRNTTLDDIEVIVVCNGSDRDSADLVLNLGKPFKLVWSEEALGFTKATNMGFKLASADYVIVLNTDAFILDFMLKDNWIDRLLAPFSNPKVGVTGLGLLWSRFGNFAPFYCAGIRKSLFGIIGYLDEQFSPGYQEDADFCIAAQRMGYTVIQVDNPMVDPKEPGRTITDYPIYHPGEQSFTDKPLRLSLIDKNYKLLEQKWG